MRSSSSLVRAAYHSHWRACSKHSAIVGDMVYLQPWPRLSPCLIDNPNAPRLVAELIDVAPPKRRDPAEPDRRVSPYSVTRTGSDVHRVCGGAGPVFHQQSDNACAQSWFEPERSNGCNAHLISGTRNARAAMNECSGVARRPKIGTEISISVSGSIETES